MRRCEPLSVLLVLITCCTLVSIKAHKVCLSSAYTGNSATCSMIKFYGMLCDDDRECDDVPCCKSSCVNYCAMEEPMPAGRR